VWKLENNIKEVETCGCREVCNKGTGCGAHLNEGLEHEGTCISLAS